MAKERSVLRTTELLLTENPISLIYMIWIVFPYPASKSGSCDLSLIFVGLCGQLHMSCRSVVSGQCLGNMSCRSLWSVRSLGAMRDFGFLPLLGATARASHDCQGFARLPGLRTTAKASCNFTPM